MSFDFEKNHIEKYISLNKDLEPNTSKDKSAFKGYIDYVAVPNSKIIEDYKENIVLLFHELSDYLKQEEYQICLETPNC